MNTNHPHGILFVVSAPSGAGKTTLCDKVLAEDKGLKYSVSCTTRPPREGEQDGVHYHFISEKDFEQKVGQGAFLEHARVHGHGYGTLRKTVEDILLSGSDVLMDVDVQGAAQLRNAIQAQGGALHKHYVDLFIAPPSMESLRERLTSRGKDSDAVIALRLDNAREEMEQSAVYQHVVVNDDLEAALSTLRAIIKAERQTIR